MADQVLIRSPSNFAKKPREFVPPTHHWIQGTWHVTHSSLPLWKGKRNVNITYDLLPPESGVIKIDDLVKYQETGSDKVKSVHGIDTPTPRNPGAFDWRGKGLLAITSSHWECIGWGVLDDDNQWIVTYFAKTLFTPAGVDVYSRRKDGLQQAALDEILEAVKALDAPEMKKLAEDVFEIPRD